MTPEQEEAEEVVGGLDRDHPAFDPDAEIELTEEEVDAILDARRQEALDDRDH